MTSDTKKIIDDLVEVEAGEPKFTFKRHAKATGLSSVAHPRAAVDIKLKGKTVGTIDPPAVGYASVAGVNDAWRVRVVMKTEQNWKWVTFKRAFADEEEARAWVSMRLANACRINNIELFPLED